MEKKYQVFVSSTYKDLTEERQEVIQALLELDCIPVGMELFPAADDDQWTLIKRLIDDCDYYILIIGGRYGSLNKEGLSYTQMEYEYALSQEIPIISFLHKNPDNIPTGKSEKAPELLKKLNEFKDLAQKKMCRYWDNAIDLGSQVSRSLVKLIKDKPRDGWVKASLLPSEDTAKEILTLKSNIELLESELEKAKSAAPEGTENLAQGDDAVSLSFQVDAQASDWRISTRDENHNLQLLTTWNEIFAAISPLMIDEVTEATLRAKVNDFIVKKTIEDLRKKFSKKQRTPRNFRIDDNDFHTLKIQFRALGMITESIKKRGVHDKNKYWIITPFGDNVMTKLRAIKRK
jgi:predicted DNA binding CopG/RHH family protein